MPTVAEQVEAFDSLHSTPENPPMRWEALLLFHDGAARDRIHPGSDLFTPRFEGREGYDDRAWVRRSHWNRRTYWAVRVHIAERAFEDARAAAIRRAENMLEPDTAELSRLRDVVMAERQRREEVEAEYREPGPTKEQLAAQARRAARKQQLFDAVEAISI